MPFTLAAPTGSSIASIVARKLKMSAIYVVLCSATLQILGFSLLASLPESTDLPTRIYNFEVIAGLGCGINISTLLLLIPFCVESRDKGTWLMSIT